MGLGEDRGVRPLPRRLGGAGCAVRGKRYPRTLRPPPHCLLRRAVRWLLLARPRGEEGGDTLPRLPAGQRAARRPDTRSGASGEPRGRLGSPVLGACGGWRRARRCRTPLRQPVRGPRAEQVPRLGVRGGWRSGKCALPLRPQRARAAPAPLAPLLEGAQVLVGCPPRGVQGRGGGEKGGDRTEAVVLFLPRPLPHLRPLRALPRGTSQQLGCSLASWGLGEVVLPKGDARAAGGWARGSMPAPLQPPPPPLSGAR